MRAFLNGKEGDVIRIPKASDLSIKGLFTADDGGQHDLSTATVDLIFYSRSNRNVTAALIAPGVVVTAANGSFTVALTEAQLNFGPGRYYAFARRTLAGVIHWGDKPTIIDII